MASFEFFDPSVPEAWYLSSFLSWFLLDICPFHLKFLTEMCVIGMISLKLF